MSKVVIKASYKGKSVKVVPSDKGGDWLTFCVDAETFGPSFRPTANGIFLAKEWLKDNGHDVD